MGIRRRLGAVLLTVGLLTAVTGCGAGAGTGAGKIDDAVKTAADTGAAQLRLPAKGDTIAVMKTTLGEMRFRLLSEDAPKAVENFTTHARNGYYDGLIFHRVIKDFMIQGGDPLGTGTGGESIWGAPFEDEFTMTAFNFRGALSMANSGTNTNGSQFFVVQASAKSLMESNGIADAKALEEALANGGWPAEAAKAYGTVGGTPHLDQKHTVFGQIYQGLDVLDKIAAVETDGSDKPKSDVKIEKLTIATYGE